MMEIQQDQAGAALVLAPSGRIDSSNARQFEEAVLKALEGGASQVLLDLDRLAYISSAGLRVILLAAQKLKAKGGALRLCALSPMILEVFEVSGFSKLIPIHATREEGLAGW